MIRDRSFRGFGWPLVVAALAVSAFGLRLFLIHRTVGYAGEDLRIYTYFADLANRGVNPYANAPVGGAISPHYLDFPSAELVFFAKLLAIHDTQTTLRVVFAFADAVVVLALGLLLPGTRRRRIFLMTFYGFNPFALAAWTLDAEDKTLVFMLLVFVLIAVERVRLTEAWAASALLAALKWLSAFYFLPLILWSVASKGIRRSTLYVTVLACGFVASVAIYLPDSLDPLQRRDERLKLPPGHASLTQYLARVHAYTPAIAEVFPALMIVAATTAFFTRRIDVRQAIVLCFFGAFVLAPDESLDRVLLVALPLMIVIELGWLRVLLLWAASLVSAIGAFGGIPFAEISPVSGLVVRIPYGLRINHALGRATGAYASIPYVTFINVFLLAAFVVFLVDLVKTQRDERLLYRARPLAGEAAATS